MCSQSSYAESDYSLPHSPASTRPSSQDSHINISSGVLQWTIFMSSVWSSNWWDSSYAWPLAWHVRSLWGGQSWMRPGVWWSHQAHIVTSPAWQQDLTLFIRAHLSYLDDVPWLAMILALKTSEILMSVASRWVTTPPPVPPRRSPTGDTTGTRPWCRHTGTFRTWHCGYCESLRRVKSNHFIAHHHSWPRLK